MQIRPRVHRARVAALAVTALAAATLAPLSLAGGQAAAAPATAAAPGSSALFTELDGYRLPTGAGALRARPRDFTAFRVDLSGLDARLDQAPTAREAARGDASGLRVQVPAPDGTLRTFKVVEDSVMQAGLQAAHPDIRTYAGRDVADPTRTIRLDVSPMGFHASVRGGPGAGAWYVDPVRDRIGTTTVVSYAASSVPQRRRFDERGLVGRDGSLLTDAQLRRVERLQAAQRSVTARRTAAGGLVTRRTYRLALATDPTYATYFGCNVDGVTADQCDDIVLAAKVTLMNRVNQIYNDDVAIKMILIDGTDDLNFATVAEASGTNGPCGASACYDEATYSGDAPDGCTGSLLTRNEFVLGQVVGADTYDIGHIMLGVNGGGIAGLGVVGTASKADGCTGLPFPTGDFMAIDYVAHEMGHQFSGNHTFDGTQGSCSATNRNGGTSVEPGSGSSVMAYAGICGTDDLQPHTDPYFSQRSIDEFTTQFTSTLSNESEEQVVTLRGFDANGDKFTLSYAGSSETIVRGTTTYTRLTVQQQMRDLTGLNVTVSGYDGASNLDDGGFTVTFPSSAGDVVALAPSALIGVTSVEMGITVNGGPATNQGFVKTETANHAPSVTAPAAKTIPIRTPFTLTGSGTDSDGDPLIYLWEQNDEGNEVAGTGLVDNNKTMGPLFRVFGTYADVSDEDTLTYGSAGENLATTSPTRTFPDIDQILADNTNAATGSCPTAGAAPVARTLVDCYSEFLPTANYQTVSGSMHFRLTARDQYPTGGGTQFADVTLTVGTAGPFRATSQGTPGTSVTGGQTGTVTWNVASTNTATYAQNVKISLSADGGQTFPYVLAASTPNNGTATVTWPQVDTTTARVKIEAINNYFFDITHADFTVVPSLSVTAPDSASTVYSDDFASAPTVTVKAANLNGSELSLAADLGLDATVVSTTADGVLPGIRTFELHGPASAEVGTHQVTLTATAPGVNSAQAFLPLSVTPEAASVAYTGTTSMVATQDPQPVALSADVVEDADGSLGDLTTSRVRFVDRADGSTLCTADIVSTGSGTGSASCAGLVDVPAGGGDVTIGTLLLDNYTGQGTDATLTLTDDSDRTAPETTITSGPADGQILVTRKSTLAYASSEDGSTFECTLDGRVKDCSAATVALSRLQPGTHLFSVAARDAAGNLDASPATRTFAVAYNDTDLVASSGWKRVKKSGAYQRNYLEARSAGRSLKLSVNSVTSIALVIDTQPGGGAVEVYLGDRLLGTVKTASGTAKYKVLTTVATFPSAKSGKLRIVTTGSKPVRIDGVGVYRPGL